MSVVLVLAAGFGQESAEFATFLSAFREEFGGEVPRAEPGAGRERQDEVRMRERGEA